MTDAPKPPLILGENGEWIPLPEGWTEPPYPPEVEAEVREGYAPPAVFRYVAAHYLREAVANLPEDVFSRTLSADRVEELVALAAGRARTAFLAGGDAEEFREDRPAFAQQQRIFDEEIPKVRAFLSDPQAREAALPIFEDVAEGFSALTLALARVLRVIPGKEGDAPGVFTASMPWAPFGLRRRALRWFTTFPRFALDTAGPQEGREIREPLEAAGLSASEITAAARRIRVALLETVRAFPFGRPFPSVRWPISPRGGVDFTAPSFGPDREITDLWAYLEPTAEAFRDLWAIALPGQEPRVLSPLEWRIHVAAWTGGDVLSAILTRETRNLVTREAAAAGEARGRSHVAFPSDLAVPALFNAGAPFRDQAQLFRVIEEEGADGALEGVTFALRMARDEDSAQLKLLDPELLGDGLRKRSLHPAAWRSEALSLLPKILGPGTLALYYATWQGVDAEGDFAFHPAPFLDLFGLKNDTRARERLEEQLRILTRVQLKIERRYGPSMGGVGVRDEARLIEESSFKRTLFFPGRPRLKLSYYRHAPPMMEIQRAYHVKVPREAFRLVGGWREGAGVKEDGVKAFALVASAYVLARTYATRADGGKGLRRYHGPGGYELPLEEILTLSGFTTPARFRKDPGRVTAAAALALDRLTGHFRLFGPATTIRNGRFRFDPPPALRADLEGIAANGAAGPHELPPEAIDVPPKPRRKRAGAKGRGR